MGSNWFMAVTADKYELPLIVEDNVYELARKLGISQSTVSCRVYRDADVQKSRTGYRIVKIKKHFSNQ